MVPPLQAMGLGELALPLAWGGGLVIPGFLLSYYPDLDPRPQVGRPNICPMYNLLGRVKRVVLWNDSFRDSMTRENIRVSKGDFNEGPSDDGVLEALK